MTYYWATMSKYVKHLIINHTTFTKYNWSINQRDSDSMINDICEICVVLLRLLLRHKVNVLCQC